MPTGTHMCCPQDTWSDRFTYEVTTAERTQRTAELADAMRWTYPTAADYVDTSPVQMGNYNTHARNFLEALHAFGSRGPHPEPCEDCASFKDSDQWLTHPVDISWWPVMSERCPVARLHFTLVILSLDEDRRHGLESGATLTEQNRRTQEREVAQKRARLKGTTVEEIVNRKMSGGI